MTYLEARNSGHPFNRRKYKDGWYLRDLRRNVDYAKIDLSQRFWTQADLEATDWWTEPMADIEREMNEMVGRINDDTEFNKAIDNLIEEDRELMKKLQEIENEEK